MMAPSTQNILVATDFSEVASYAIEHAVKFSRILEKEITLLHIIKKETEYDEANSYMKSQVEDTFHKFGVKVQAIIREGSIFTTIGEVANELDASMVVMGTHGRKGMQKITGSWALKVTVSAKAPVMVVKESPKNQTIRKIVFPVDFRSENKEKVGWACFVARTFDARVVIFKSNFRDKGFIRAIFSNMHLTERTFKSRGISYEVSVAEPKRNFAEQTVEFAQKVEADLILISTTRSITFADYILGASEQYIIDNSAKIPVLCINPRELRVGSFSATGG